jgi:hypothetical protein
VSYIGSSPRGAAMLRESKAKSGANIANLYAGSGSGVENGQLTLKLTVRTRVETQVAKREC